MACGTGMIASAFAANHLYNLPFPLTFEVLSKKRLQVFLQKKLVLSGPVEKLMEFNRKEDILAST